MVEYRLRLIEAIAQSEATLAEGQAELERCRREIDNAKLVLRTLERPN